MYIVESNITNEICIERFVRVHDIFESVDRCFLTRIEHDIRKEHL